LTFPGKRLSVSAVVLTRNEEANVLDALASLLGQREPPLEILVIDGGSADATREIVAAVAAKEPHVRLIAPDGALSVAASRNLGVREAKGDVVAFMSADATADARWIDRTLAALHGADLVFGRQEHAPGRASVAAAVRGLRYHIYERDLAPEAYASNVTSAARRSLRLSLPSDEDAAGSVIDDVLLARRALRRGHRVAYAPDMVVHHRDKTTLLAEHRKVRREAEAWGAKRRETGLLVPVLAWGGLLALAAAGFALVPHPISFAILAMALFAPALRRVTPRAFRRYGWRVAPALLASPILDLAFLLHYVKAAVKA
jgi:succinoglycan biosynthesis protein ExoA